MHPHIFRMTEGFGVSHKHKKHKNACQV